MRDINGWVFTARVGKRIRKENDISRNLHELAKAAKKKNNSHKNGTYSVIWIGWPKEPVKIWIQWFGS